MTPVSRLTRRRAAGALAAIASVAAVGAALPGLAAAEVEAPVLTVTLTAGGTLTVVDEKGAAAGALNPDSYQFVVHDQSTTANVHLTGPGGVNQLTDVAGTGDVTWSVTLGTGSFTIGSDAGSVTAVKLTVGGGTTPAATATPAATTTTTTAKPATTTAAAKIAAAPAPAAGKACTKAGLVAKSGKTTLVCTKKGAALTWAVKK